MSRRANSERHQTKERATPFFPWRKRATKHDALTWGPLGLLALLSGCVGERTQSSLHPAGEAAEIVAGLWWFMFYLLGSVFLIVIVVAGYAVFRRRLDADQGEPVGERFIIVCGIVLPAVVLLALLVYSLSTTLALRRPASTVTIEVIGHQWWWEVRYPAEGIVTANELHIPVGEPVRLELTSADVVHSFWVPQLQGKRDLLPDHVNTFWLQATRAGVYRGQCAEYCGQQHARMALHVIALEAEAYDAWVARRREAAREAAPPSEQPGERMLMAAGCNACHTIRGTSAAGEVGPDLTHFGSRQTIGAGQWPNTYDNLARWIDNPQALKPGNEMPRSELDAAELHAITTYLLSLE